MGPVGEGVSRAKPESVWWGRHSASAVAASAIVATAVAGAVGNIPTPVRHFSYGITAAALLG